MNWMSPAALAVLLALPASSQEGGKLSAAIGADGVYFTMRDLKKARLFLLLFNEGSEPVEPAKMAAKLYVDGRPVDKEAALTMLKDGPPGAGWKRLEPGAHFQFGIRLDALLDRPGLHRIVWKGDDFASNEVRILVAADRPKGPRRIGPKDPGTDQPRPLH
jgi:hypothetical protein